MLLKVGDKGFIHPVPSEITPQDVYLDRRRWLQGAALTAGLAALPSLPVMARPERARSPLAATPSILAGASLSEKKTDYEDVVSYNNFYEFGTDKSDPGSYPGVMPLRPWAVSVEGLVKKPQVFDIEALLKLAPLEERVYRMRCVEGWSMVIPWIGYSLSHLIRKVEPLGSAKFISFESLADPRVMPGIKRNVLDWPYLEGLRMDEAMHPLSLLTFGLYGEALLQQNGAPLRMVMPWKYGFKNGKSIVRFRFQETAPLNSWQRAAPQEYGFYANVNPEVDHPRWSQATERRIGDGLFQKKRKTLMFNGYEAQVGSLYAGMDLRRYF